MRKLTKKEVYQALCWAFWEAKGMKGLYCGHPDPEVFQGYKQCLASARQALEQIRPKYQRKP